MKLVTIWMCEDLGDPEQSGFGRIKQDAESLVSGNRGYDYYDHSGFAECVEDGWARPAVQITVPNAVALVLLNHAVV